MHTVIEIADQELDVNYGATGNPRDHHHPSDPNANPFEIEIWDISFKGKPIKCDVISELVEEYIYANHARWEE